MPRPTLPIVFGLGTDRASTELHAGPERMEVLENVVLSGDGGVEARGGLAEASTVADSTYQAGIIAARSINESITVDGFGIPGQSSHVLKIGQREGDGTGHANLGTWLDPCHSSERARVIGVETGARVILSHDEPTLSRRGRTVVVNTATGAITDLTATWADEDDANYGENLHFRGVCLHLNRVVGWGFGTNKTDEGHMARISLADSPVTFDELDYWRVGQSGDPLLHAISVSQGDSAALLFLKESEAWFVGGYDNNTFNGPYRIDQRHGIAASRLAVSDGANVFTWGMQGPRVFQGVRESEDIGWRLGLPWPRTRDLEAAGVLGQGFAEYLPRKGGGVVLFTFDTYVYAFDLRTREWSHWVLPFGVHCGAVLYASTAYQGPSRGYPDFGSVAAVDEDSVLISYSNVLEEGDETVELFVRLSGGAWPAAADQSQSVTADPVFQVDGLAAGDYEAALRYVRDGQYTEGYTGDPDTWPAVSLGTFTVSGDPVPPDLDPPTLLAADPGSPSYACEPIEIPSAVPCLPTVTYNYTWTVANATDDVVVESKLPGGAWTTLAVLAPNTSAHEYERTGEPSDSGNNDVDLDGRHFRIRHSRLVGSTTYYSDPSNEILMGPP